jgi:hypothetical protein
MFDASIADTQHRIELSLSSAHYLEREDMLKAPVGNPEAETNTSNQEQQALHNLPPTFDASIADIQHRASRHAVHPSGALRFWFS